MESVIYGNLCCKCGVLITKGQHVIVRGDTVETLCRGCYTEIIEMPSIEVEE